MLMPSSPGGRLARLRECHGCGQLQSVPALPVGSAAHCLRCDTVIRRHRRHPVPRALACSIAALAFYVLAMALPLITINAEGRLNENTIFTGPIQLADRGLWLLGALVLLTTVVIPGVKLGVTLTVLLGLRLRRPPRWVPDLYGWIALLRPWSMIEVFLLGVFVAYTRLTQMAEVTLHVGLYAIGAVMILLAAADSSLDSDSIWDDIERRGLRRPVPEPSRPGPLLSCSYCAEVSCAAEGTPCPRCGSRLYARRPQSMARTAALTFTAALLYIPANIYPVMTIVKFGQQQPNTIMSGVRELIAYHLWPLALLVFFASITVPVLKLVALTFMLVMTWTGSSRWLRGRLRLYHAIEFIGRWSMIDVFMISILTALVRMGFLASVIPDIGALAFAAVVVLTMFATSGFDPRLMYDAAEDGARREVGDSRVPA